METRLAEASASELAKATPASRDRFLDLVRAASILLVVLGHYTIAGVVRARGLQGTNALSSSAWLRLATWGVQVMPLFFFVGGVTNAFTLRRPHPDVGSFLQRRLRRLATPAMVFVAVWVVAALVSRAVGADAGTVEEGARIAAQPLWFLAVYLLVISVASVQWRVHRRWRWALLPLLPLLVATLDILRLTGVATGAADVNYLLVFVFAQELGFWYADGALPELPRRLLLALGAAAVALLVVITAVGPYPVSMVGVPGEALSNMSPPTTCILLLTIAQVMLLTAARPALTRWLQSPRVWRTVVAANGGLLTVFLWHLTAFVVVAAVLAATGVPLPPAGSAGWWAAKPLWLVLSFGVLAALVSVFVRVERSALLGQRQRPAGSLREYAAVVAVAAGLAVVAAAGLTDIAQAGGRHLLGVAVSPVQGLVLLMAGFVLDHPR